MRRARSVKVLTFHSLQTTLAGCQTTTGASKVEGNNVPTGQSDVYIRLSSSEVYRRVMARYQDRWVLKKFQGLKCGSVVNTKTSLTSRLKSVQALGVH